MRPFAEQRDHQSTPRRRWQRVVFRVALVIAIPLAISGLLLLKAKWEVERKLAAIRARGEPTTAEEMEAWYPAPPPEEDATELWLEAGKLAGELPYKKEWDAVPIIGHLGPEEPPLPEEPWPNRELTAEFLEDRQEVIALAHQAADRGGRAQFAVGFDRISDSLDEGQAARLTAMVLQL